MRGVRRPKRHECALERRRVSLELGQPLSIDQATVGDHAHPRIGEAPVRPLDHRDAITGMSVMTGGGVAGYTQTYRRPSPSITHRQDHLPKVRPVIVSRSRR